jgi:hypothetical protein
LAHQTKEKFMTTGNSVRKVAKVAVLGALALAGLGWGAAASAQNVFWSVGVASPGVQVAVSNAPAVVYQHHYPVVVQQPVVVYPQRVVVQPVPVYSAYPVYGGQMYSGPVYGGPVYGRPVVVQQPVVVAGWHGHHRGWHHGWDRGWNRGWDGDHRGHGGMQQPTPQPMPQHGQGGGHR